MKPHETAWKAAWKQRETPWDITLWLILESWLHSTWNVEGYGDQVWEVFNIVDVHSDSPLLCLKSSGTYIRKTLAECTQVEIGGSITRELMEGWVKTRKENDE